MKIVKVSYLITLLASACASQAGIFVESEIEKPLQKNIRNVRVWQAVSSLEDLHSPEERKKQLIEKNFENIKCITPLAEFAEVNQKFKMLTTSYPRDMNLKLFYARFLLSFKNFAEGFDEFSKFISSNTATKDQTEEFMNWLKMVDVEKQPLKLYLDNINDCITNPTEYAKRKKLANGIKSLNSASGIKQLNSRITNSLLENTTSLFGLLGRLPTKTLYDATLGIIINTLDQHNHESTASKLVSRLYTQNEGQASPLVKEYYAFRCLMKEKQYERALPLYESILGTNLNPDNPRQISENYNRLAICYYMTTNPIKQKTHEDIEDYVFSPEDRIKLQKSIDLLEAVLVFDENPPPTIFKNLTGFYMWLKQYDKAFSYFNKLRDVPEKTREEFNISTKRLNRDYKILLQRAGRTEEVTQLLLARQAKAMSKNKKMSVLIQAAQEQHQLEKELAQLRERKRQETLTASLLKKQTETTTTTTTTTQVVLPQEDNFQGPFSNSESKERDKSLVKREKKKTHNPANKQKADQKQVYQKQVVSPMEPEIRRSFVTIDEITESSGTCKTFEKLFSRYWSESIPDNKIKISHNEIVAMFKALGQEYGPNRGTRHHKATLNFQEVGIDMEEQMLTIAKHTYLIPEQIRDIRDAFLVARIVPNDPDIIKKLQDKGLL